MRIVIDARMLYWTGVGRYTQALLDNLQIIDRKNEYIVLVRKTDWALWEPKAENFRKVEANINPYTFAEQLKLPGLLKKLKPDLVHFTAPNAPALYKGRKVVSIHDLTLIDYDTSRGSGLGQMLRRYKRLPFRYVMRHDVKSAAAIITPTEHIKDRIVQRYHRTDKMVRAVYLAVDPNLAEAQSIEHFDIGGGFLLYVGNFYPYKNVGVAIEAFAEVRKSHPKLKFVVVGKPDYFREVLERQVKRLGLEGSVVFTGFVTDGELKSLYRSARLYIYPSLSEGFGLQGLEAMAQGLPVVAARASCLPEVYGEAAQYFDPTSAPELAATIQILLLDPKRCAQLRAAGNKRYREFSWEKTARETLLIYQKVLKG